MWVRIFFFLIMSSLNIIFTGLQKKNTLISIRTFQASKYIHRIICLCIYCNYVLQKSGFKIKNAVFFFPRKVEGELEVIWESTSKENRRMRELLHKSLGKNDMWNTVTVQESYLDEVSQKDLVYGHDFSYCDVKPSPTKNEIHQES